MATLPPLYYALLHVWIRVFGEEPPDIPRRINPLPVGLAWIRGLDFEPVLTAMATINESEAGLVSLRKDLHERSH